MLIQRQSEQWPHRREAMLRAAVESYPGPLRDDWPKPGDNPAEQKWYHASPQELAPTTLLNLNGAPSPFGGNQDVNDLRGVWMSPSLEEAHSWRQGIAQNYQELDDTGDPTYRPTHIYEIKPIGRVHDYDCDGYAARSAIVVQKVYHDPGFGPRTASLDYDANDYGITPYHDVDWEDDEDDEPMDGYIRENNPVRLKSPLYPDGNKSRPSFADDLDDLGGNRKIYHFSPHDFNPPSDSPARGDAYWPRYRKDPPEGVLPLNLPDMAMPNMPTDRNPIPLYRGVNLRLDHPDLQWIRRAIHGDSREDIEDHQFTPGARWSPHFTDRDRTDGIYFGLPHRQPYLDPSMTNRNLASPMEEGDTDILYDHDLQHRMTHTILDHMNDQKGGLGTHWGMGEDNARSFADFGNGFGHSAPSLPVVITHHWKGIGEDPYRRETEGEWPDEQEITHLHGAKANVAAVHVKHPHHGWTKIFDADDHGETLTHKASR